MHGRRNKLSLERLQAGFQVTFEVDEQLIVLRQKDVFDLCDTC